MGSLSVLSFLLLFLNERFAQIVAQWFEQAIALLGL